jgi:hypothetical protein
MRYSLIYGTIAGAIASAAIVATIAFKLPNHAHSVWFGYLVMLASLSLIFVGLKRYRDVECGGVIGFGRAVGLGIGIAVVAGIIYMLGWELYVRLSGWDFMKDYSASVIKSMHDKGASAAALQAKTAELRELATRFRNPLYRLSMTFIEIFPVGLIVALISAALLRNPRLLPDSQRPVDRRDVRI